MLQLTIDEIYKEEILEHYNHPKNFRELKDSNAHFADANPLCGDEVKVWIKSESGLIKDISFKGTGCAISIAASSMLTESVKGKHVKELIAMTPETMLNMLGIHVGPVRLKCALLGLMACKKAVVKAQAGGVSMLE